MPLKRVLPLLAAAMLAALLSGCFLLPKEAEIPALPLVTPYDGSDFKTAAVQRGDLTLKKSVSCTYQATSQVNHSFGETGEYFGGIYVAVGDEVKAGDLLAEMDVGNIDATIRDCESGLKRYEIELAAAREAYELALRTQALTGDTEDAASKARAANVEYLEATLEIQKMKLAEFTAERDSRRIYAQIDGSVTYVKTIQAGVTTVRGEKVVTVTDNSTSMFVANTDQPEYFLPGTDIDVHCEGEVYRTIVRSPDSLGAAESASSHSILTRIYLALLDAEAPASTNARGEIELLIDSRSDVLYVNSSAVFTIGGQSMVYVMLDDGSTELRHVTVGLTSGRYIEITEGLAEGDVVITG